MARLLTVLILVHYVNIDHARTSTLQPYQPHVPHVTLQRLKPGMMARVIDTTKLVPCPQTIHIASSNAASKEINRWSTSEIACSRKLRLSYRKADWPTRPELKQSSMLDPSIFFSTKFRPSKLLAFPLLTSSLSRPKSFLKNAGCDVQIKVALQAQVIPVLPTGASVLFVLVQQTSGLPKFNLY